MIAVIIVVVTLSNAAMAWRLHLLQKQIDLLSCKLMAYRHYMALGGLFGEIEKTLAMAQEEAPKLPMI